MNFLLGSCAVQHAWVSGYAPDEYHTAKTPDDWTLALYRFKAPPGSPLKTPVVLCHGGGMNGYIWDIKKEKSFARYLRNEGFDVWIVELRGAGRSSKPGWVMLHDLMSGPDLAPTRYENTSFRFDHADWNIDDYIDKDMPAILDKVKTVTGSGKVQWVGHSLGGMIALAYIIKTQDASLKDVVAMASPMNMPHPHNDLLAGIEQHADLKQIVYLINNRVAARTFGFLGIFGSTPMDPLLYNRDNMDNDVVNKLLQTAVEDMSPGVVDGYVTLIKGGEFVSADKTVNYTRSLDKIQIPLLLIGGSLDTMCSTVSLYDTYRSVRSEDKALRIFGRANGYKKDYGHNDLVLGKHAQDEVYPYAARWLKERSS